MYSFHGYLCNETMAKMEGSENEDETSGIQYHQIHQFA